MKRIILLLLLISTVTGRSYPQGLSRQNAAAFIRTVADKGGKWIALNPTYKEGQESGFPAFHLQFQSHDSLSVNVRITAINTKGESILLWEIWEFFRLDENRGLITQRSPSGIYATGDAFFETPNERTSEITIRFPDKTIVKHKDVHAILTDGTMKSISFDFDESTAGWVIRNELRWHRNTENKNIPND